MSSQPINKWTCKICKCSLPVENDYCDLHYEIMMAEKAKAKADAKAEAKARSCLICRCPLPLGGDYCDYHYESVMADKAKAKALVSKTVCALPGCSNPRNVASNGYTYQHCSIPHCKEDLANKQARQYRQSKERSTRRSPERSIATIVPTIPKCGLDGCDRKCATSSSGHVYTHCSNAHYDEHKQKMVPLCSFPGCVAQCHVSMDGQVSSHCSRTHYNASKKSESDSIFYTRRAEPTRERRHERDYRRERSQERYSDYY